MPVRITLGAKDETHYTMNKIYIYRGSSVLYVAMALLSSASIPLIAHDLVLKRPKAALQSWQKLRDTCGERLSAYMELLVESLSLIAQEKVIDNKGYVYHLQQVEYFLKHGSLSESHVDDESSELLGEVARVQKELLRTFRSILERDAASCFVTCKIKSQLEQRVQTVERFIEEEKKYQRIFKNRS
jgi:hypothetical protein